LGLGILEVTADAVRGNNSIVTGMVDAIICMTGVCTSPSA
jgi:hypothetical protein